MLAVGRGGRTGAAELKRPDVTEGGAIIGGAESEGGGGAGVAGTGGLAATGTRG